MSAIRYEVADSVATITIDRPEKRNAMTYRMVGAFTEAIWRAADDEAARVVVITGSGGSFCAGTDLSDLDDTPSNERISAAKMDDSRAAVPWPIVACPKPVIAAVDGPAVGMGVEYATMSDVRVATDRARFGWVFVRRGLVPDMGAGGFLLPRIVGHTEALRLQLSGELIDAEEAAGGGSIVNVSSIAGLQGVGVMAAYSTSKFALRDLSRSASVALGHRGIRVNSVHPGPIDTEMIAEFRDPSTLARRPIPRYGTATEVADVVTFLASDESSFMTGAEVVVDGGAMAGI